MQARMHHSARVHPTRLQVLLKAPPLQAAALQKHQGKLLQYLRDIPPPPGTHAVYGPTPTGDRLKQLIGAPNALCITPGPNQVLFVGETTFPGRIFKVALDGKVLGVIGRSGRQLGQFSGAHQLACPSENEIYAAETANWRVQKLLLK